MLKSKWITLACAALLLSACGSDSDSATESTTSGTITVTGQGIIPAGPTGGGSPVLPGNPILTDVGGPGAPGAPGSHGVQVFNGPCVNWPGANGLLNGTSCAPGQTAYCFVLSKATRGSGKGKKAFLYSSHYGSKLMITKDEHKHFRRIQLEVCTSSPPTSSPYQIQFKGKGRVDVFFRSQNGHLIRQELIGGNSCDMHDGDDHDD